ncbi:hypothetical protein F441_23119 [Phytophthora nicotianae CJ01A1]|uniref:Uncharacterized protein n=1 Tax=Phytophthora nicotianae CJ01A1 TaxID=1317063 RepID=W2VM62_PHYNI|nr:hypothetical protein F441_23119 [Phytophthora nicotianae CJ01A1]
MRAPIKRPTQVSALADTAMSVPALLKQTLPRAPMECVEEKFVQKQSARVDGILPILERLC